MKFKCNSIDLQKAINIVEKAIAVRSALPILENIYMDLSDNQLILRGNDLELGIEYRMPINSIEEPGTILTKSKTMSSIIAKLPNQSLNLTVKEEKIKITGNNADFTIHSENSEDYPVFPSIESGQLVHFTVAELRQLIQHTVFSVSFDETKKFLNGILIKNQDKKLVFVATDGYRLALKKSKTTTIDTNFEVIAPYKAVYELNKILQGVADDQEIQMSVSEKQVAFKMDQLVLISRVIQGQFPDYNQVIPDSSEYRYNISKDELLIAAERAAIIASSSNNVVKLLFDNNQLVITASAPALGDFKESLQTKEGSCSHSAKIALNVRLILDVIKIIDTDEVSFLFNNELSPCQLIPLTDNSFTYIIMPIRTSDFQTTPETVNVESEVEVTST